MKKLIYVTALIGVILQPSFAENRPEIQQLSRAFHQKDYDRTQLLAKAEEIRVKDRMATLQKQLKKYNEAKNFAQAEKTARELTALKRGKSSLEELAKTPLDHRRASFAIRSLTMIDEGVDDSLFDNLNEAGFRLRKSFSEVNSDIPAQFSFSRDLEADSDTVYGADFFLSWSPHDMSQEDGTPLHEPWRSGNSMFSYNLSVEGHLSSKSNSVHDAWRFRATGAHRWYDSKNHWGFILNSSLKDESDRDLNFHRLSAEFMLIPVWPEMAIGRYQPSYDGLLFEGKRPIAGHPVEFRWQPYFGADLGGIVSGSESTLGMGVADESWLTQRTTAELKLNFLEEHLGLRDVLLYADNSFHYAMRSQENFNHFEAGLNFKLSENAGFGIVYKNGEEAPSFVKEESIQGAFTIIF